MKLSLAVSILAQGLPVTTSSSALREDDLRMVPADRRRRMYDVDGTWESEEGAGSSSSIGLTMQLSDDDEGMGGRARSGFVARVIQNLREQKEVVECDPTATVGTDMGDVTLDVGVLGCGVGQYCAESSVSRLGGLCADIKVDMVGSDGESPHDDADVVARFQIHQRRDLQTNNLIEQLQYVCDYSSLVGYECECNFDDYYSSGNYTGSTSCVAATACVTKPSACGANSTVCYDKTYSVDVLGPGTYDTELCYIFSVPYNQTLCYSGNLREYGKSMEACEIDFNGVQCNECSPIPNVNATGNSTDFCYNFDCSNTAGGNTGNRCTFPAATIRFYAETYGCPPCLVCDPENTDSGAELTLPDATVMLYGINYTCQYISDVALKGFFTPEACSYFSSVAYEPCGCAPPTDAPVKTPAPTKSNDTEVVKCDPCSGGDLVNPNGTVTVPGSGEFSCEDVATAGNLGKIPADLCPALQQLAVDPCCTADASTVEVCNPCGEDREMTILDGMVSVPTIGMFTCQQLLDQADAGNLTGSLCVVTRTFVQTPCGCRATVPTVAPTEMPASDPFLPSPTGSPSAAEQPMAQSWTVRLSAGVGIAFVAHAVLMC